MQIELKPLRCFVALAEELHFHRAAARLNLTQPALSAQIRALERQVGFALFDRTTRRVDLTEAAAELLPHARHLLDESRQLHHLVDRLRRAQVAPMHLGAAFYTIDIPERVALLEGFFDRHPDVPLDVSTAYQNPLVAMLRRGTIDVALLLGMPVPRALYAAELARNPEVETIFPDDLPRLVLRREPVAFLWPRAMAPGAVVPLAAVAGQKIAMIGRNHGDALVRPICDLLVAAGAQVVIPPESHAIAVERYARQFELPAISLGWFGGADDDQLVRRPLEGVTIATEFSVVRSPSSTAAGLPVFWEACRHMLDRSLVGAGAGA